jgi:hypothetical protein
MRQEFERNRFDPAYEEDALRKQSLRPSFPVSRPPIAQGTDPMRVRIGIGAKIRDANNKKRGMKITMPSLDGWGDNA